MKEWFDKQPKGLKVVIVAGGLMVLLAVVNSLAG